MIVFILERGNEHVRLEEGGIILDNDGKTLSIRIAGCVTDTIDATLRRGSCVMVYPNWKIRADNADVATNELFAVCNENGNDAVIRSNRRNARCEIISNGTSMMISQEMGTIVPYSSIEADIQIREGQFTITAKHPADEKAAIWTKDHADSAFDLQYEGVPEAECFIYG